MYDLCWSNSEEYRAKSFHTSAYEVPVLADGVSYHFFNKIATFSANSSRNRRLESITLACDDFG
jgi:hypothetical protein